MRVWGADDVVDAARTSVAIGVFDGVHVGHREILRVAREAAHDAGIPAIAVTFDPHPAAVLDPSDEMLLLSTFEQRLALIEEQGMDGAYAVDFTAEFTRLTAQEFVDTILVDRLHVVHAVTGVNFHFGSRAAGDAAFLASAGRAAGFVADAVPLLGDDAGVWSSTRIRSAVLAGDLAEAQRGLRRPHRVEGVVVTGDQRGRDLGYPTANLAPTPHATIPADGVYAGWLVADPYGSPSRLPAAISIGTNPTFDGSERRIEAYVLDRDDLELYGVHVALDFAERLRPTLRFDSVDDLLAQMAGDVARTREVVTATDG